MADNTTIKDASATNVTVASDDVSGVQYQRVKVAFGADGSATDASATTPLPGGTYVQNSSGAWVPAGFGTGGGPVPSTLTHPLSQALGIAASITAYGYLRVANEPSSLFVDSFETLDTTNRWTTGGTVTPTVTGGRASLAPSTTTSATSSLVSQPTFPPIGVNFTAAAWLATFENSSGSAGGLFTTNNHRFMGFGTIPGTWTPTYTASNTTGPLLDAIGFEIDTDGKLYPVVYSNGVRVRPGLTLGGTDLNTGNAGSGQGGTRTLANGSTHSFTLVFRTDILLWFLDGIEWPVAVLRYSDASFTIPNVQALPLRYHSINAGSAPGTAPVLSVAACAVGDTGNNNVQLSDSVYPFRKMQVGKSGGISIKGASPTITTASMGTATGTAGPTDVSEAGNVTFTIKNTTAASAFAAGGVVVFEQSDDNVSWSPLVAVRVSTGLPASTHVLGANAASTSMKFDAACEGANWVRARLTAAVVTNGATIVITPGGMGLNPGVSVQPIARTTVNLTASGLTAGTTATEATVTMSQQKGNSNASSASSFVIPNGKTFRIQSIGIGIVGNATATIASVAFRLRINATGSVVVGSTLSWTHRLAVPAVAGQGLNQVFTFGDGMDIVGDGTLQYGFTINPVFTTNAPTYDITVTGYEY